MTDTDQPLDVITIGRSSVDLYGQQIGGRLEDMASFAKSVGGCPANIAIGAARLGLRSAYLGRVGDDHFGRFIREQFGREGVADTGTVTDPARLTALAILGVRDETTFPLLFYRENCADMALDEGDIDPAFIASAAALVVTGTHFGAASTASAQRKAMRLMHDAGGRVIFDIDYRPNLWGLAGKGAGEERFVASQTVTDHLQPILPECDLIVGTEEELMIAGGSEDVHAALRAVRVASAATIVLKRGPLGCVVYPDAIPDRIEDGIVGTGFRVEVFNVLGAGDGFMAGFLRGWLRDEPLETCCTWANACGAVAVSRLLCAPEYPTWEELRLFLRDGSTEHALRKDETLNHIHRATTRRDHWPVLRAFAIDHRKPLEDLADRLGADRGRIPAFKELAVAAAARVADGRPGYGMLLDDTYGREALFRAVDHRLWIGRPVEVSQSRPMRFETGEDLGSGLVDWPLAHTVKCLCLYHPDDPEELRAAQEARLLQLHQACRAIGRDYLLEIIAGKHGALADGTVATVLDRLYDLGLKPDWWKLEPQAGTAAWGAIGAVIERSDPHCRGVVVLGLEAPEDDLARAFAAAAATPWVKGFAVGRTLFAAAAERWLKGEIDDDAAIDDMATRYARLCAIWDAAGN